MPEQTNSEHEREVRRIARDALWDECEIERVETITRGSAEGEVMLEVGGDIESSNRNAFAGRVLVEFLEAGYVPTSVGGGSHGHTAWFEPLGVGLDIEGKL